jgi:hypothetical protein
MVVIGMTRFSIVTESTLLSFPPHRGDSYKDVFESIYDKTRMSRRLELFKNVCLASIKCLKFAEGVDFYYLVFISSEMPEVWRNKLVQTLPPFARLVSVDKDENFFGVTLREMRKINSTAFTFRLDDDDGLCHDYLRLVQANAQYGKVLSFDKGWYVSGGIAGYGVRIKETPNIAIGLGYYGDKTIYNLGNHTLIEDAVRLTGKPYWVRTVHDQNISGVKDNSLPMDLESASEKLRNFRYADSMLSIL